MTQYHRANLESGGRIGAFVVTSIMILLHAAASGAGPLA